jgi:hypothetical protein
MGIATAHSEEHVIVDVRPGLRGLWANHGVRERRLGAATIS